MLNINKAKIDFLIGITKALRHPTHPHPQAHPCPALRPILCQVACGALGPLLLLSSFLLLRWGHPFVSLHVVQKYFGQSPLIEDVEDLPR